MPFSLDQILSDVDRINGLLEATIDNTLSFPYKYEDYLCGNVGLCGNETGFLVETNANIAVSSDSVPHLGTTLALTGRLEFTSEIGEPFSGSVTSVSYANITLLNDESIEDFENRFFEDSICSIKIGGLVNKGQPDQENIPYSDFQTIFDGRLGSHESNVQLINLPVLPIRDELAEQFPRVFEFGESEGKAKPFILGQVFGYAPFPVFGTLRVFHDGDVDAQAHKYVNPPFTYFGNDIEIAHSEWGVLLGSNNDGDVTNVTHDSDDFDFSIISDTELRSTESIDTDISVSGDGVSLEPVNGGFRVVREGAESAINFTQRSHQRWVRQPDQGGNIVLHDLGVLNARVTLSSGINFWSIGPNLWFKLGQQSNGRVTFTFPNKKIKRLKLAARALINGSKEISNFSHEPISISPPTDSTGRVQNHVVTFRDVDSDSISFDYLSTPSVFTLSVFWIEEIELVDQTPARIEIDFERNVHKMTLQATLNGIISLSDFSQDIANNAVPISGTTSDLQINEFGQGHQFNRLAFNCNIGSGGATFIFDSVSETSSDYGAFREGAGFVLRPRPQFDFADPFNGNVTVAGSAEVSTFIEDENQPFNAGVKYRYRSRMRVLEGEIDEVFVELSYPVFRKIRVGREWTDIDTIIDNVGGNAMVVTARATRGITSVNSPNPINPDEDFAIEVDYVLCQIVGNGVSDFPIYENTNGRDIRIPLYRISDANRYHELPSGIAFYDDKGNLALSTEYADVHGDFIGGDRDQKSIPAFRDISVRTTGVDYITSHLNNDGERLSHVLDSQKPWFQHIAEISNSIDYILSEFRVGDGFNVRRRYDFKDDPVDFVIEEHEVAVPRQYRYEFTYRKNHRNERLTRSYSSPVGHTGRFDALDIETPLYNLSDVESLGELISRDSVANNLRVLSLHGVERANTLFEGAAGYINHPRMPANSPCIIRSITPSISLSDDTSQTRILVKILRGGR